MGFFETAQLVSGRMGGQFPQSCTNQPIRPTPFSQIERLSQSIDPDRTDGGSVQKLLSVLLEGLKKLNVLVIEDMTGIFTCR